MQEEMWQYSRELDPEEVKKTGCFTTLPVRINNRDEIANGASLRVLKDWALHTKTTELNMTRVSFSPVGSFCSLVYPETLPERLDSISYLTDLFFLIDDATEEMTDHKAAQEEWRDFSGAMTETLNEAPKRDHDLEFLKKKKLASQVMLEFMRIDPDLGLELVKTCKAGWTAEAAGVHWESIEDYLVFRRLSAGLDIFWGKTVFGLGWKLTDHEEKLIKPIVWAAEKAAMLNNDYWSWEIEYDAADFKIEQLTNAVAVLMRKDGLSAQEGKDRIKHLILGYEAEYLRLKASFYQEHPSARLHLRKRVEIAGSVAAGVSFWSANSPRYHVPERSSEGKAIENVVSCTQEKDVKALALSTRTTVGAMSNSDVELTDSAYLSSTSSTSENLSERSSSSSLDQSSNDSLHFKMLKLNHEALDAPMDYIGSMPSKGVRSSLIDAFNQWFEVPSVQLKIVRDVLSKLHNSSLVLDDIQDDSPLRRGKTATHLIYGAAQSINSANFHYVSVVKAVHETGNAGLMTVLLEELEDLHVGQSWDLYWKYNLRWPTEEEYFSMIDLKTGGLFRMLLRMMQLLSRSAIKDFAFDNLISMVSRYFQVRDDYLNLCSREYTTQKGWCEDLDEGKFSYPIIHCLHNAKSSCRDRIIGLFRQRILSPGSSMQIESKIQIIELLREAGTLDACWEMLNTLEDEIEAEIKKLESITTEPNPMMHLLLKLLSIKSQKPEQGPIVVPEK
ncbi:geranylgeranyl pyrophosphate synthase [Coleophoma crateriformis]|uniref:Geranylgeranyl pyrophosphate synthase n=1 Tax=Coleophoma crateriformis TaxID=565419 RepID=A0A3D8QKY1_9HELO|nr:geranylgeranyl pyrophosphate synthase [Coleophoma crateriformis]